MLPSRHRCDTGTMATTLSTDCDMFRDKRRKGTRMCTWASCGIAATLPVSTLEDRLASPACVVQPHRYLGLSHLLSVIPDTAAKWDTRNQQSAKQLRESQRRASVVLRFKYSLGCMCPGPKTRSRPMRQL